MNSRWVFAAIMLGAYSIIFLFLLERDCPLRRYRSEEALETLTYGLFHALFLFGIGLAPRDRIAPLIPGALFIVAGSFVLSVGLLFGIPSEEQLAGGWRGIRIPEGFEGSGAILIILGWLANVIGAIVLLTNRWGWAKDWEAGLRYAEGQRYEERQRYQEREQVADAAVPQVERVGDAAE